MMKTFRSLWNLRIHLTTKGSREHEAAGGSLPCLKFSGVRYMTLNPVTWPCKGRWPMPQLLATIKLGERGLNHCETDPLLLQA